MESSEFGESEFQTRRRRIFPFSYHRLTCLNIRSRRRELSESEIQKRVHKMQDEPQIRIYSDESAISSSFKLCM